MIKAVKIEVLQAYYERLCEYFPTLSLLIGINL